MSRAAKVFTIVMAFLLVLLIGTDANLAQTNQIGRDYRNHLTPRSVLSDKKGILSGNNIRSHLKPPANQLPESSPDPTPKPNPPLPAPQAETDITETPAKPPAVKGVYLTSWMTGNQKFLNQMLTFISHTEINTVVIDVKDDTGLVSFPSSVPLASEVGAGCRKFDPAQVLTLLKQNQIYTIARIVVFKDPLLAKARPDLAVQSSQGGLWRDKLGLCWVDPHNQKVWEYNVAIAKTAARAGFDEIQFDYVRFTSDGRIQDCRYPGADGRPKADVIRDFLKYAYQELSPMGVKVSVDVFGLVCSADDDLGIGQVLEKVVANVDVVCPMVYPSHYPNGTYNIKDPDAAPYETISQSLNYAKKRLDHLSPRRKVILRPWLQDFSLRHHYSRGQLLAQIRAVRDAGFREYIFWNPSNKYDERKYLSKGEALVAEKPVLPQKPEVSNVPDQSNPAAQEN